MQNHGACSIPHDGDGISGVKDAVARDGGVAGHEKRRLHGLIFRQHGRGRTECDHEVARSTTAETHDKRLGRSHLGLHLVAHVPDRHQVFLRHDGILDDHVDLEGLNPCLLQGLAPRRHRHVRGSFAVSNGNLRDSKAGCDLAAQNKAFFLEKLFDRALLGR